MRPALVSERREAIEQLARDLGFGDDVLVLPDDELRAAIVAERRALKMIQQVPPETLGPLYLPPDLY